MNPRYLVGEPFTYKSQFATYPNCQFVIDRYANPDNLYLGICMKDPETDSLEQICHCTANTHIKLPDDRITVKNYSENEGMEEFLIKEGIIEEHPYSCITSGFVIINVFKLTEKGKKLYVPLKEDEK